MPRGEEHARRSTTGPTPRYPTNVSPSPRTWEVFTLMSWRDRRLAAISQAGLVEKFVDALVWVFFPVFLYQHGVSLPDIGWIVGVYGFVWGGVAVLHRPAVRPRRPPEAHRRRHVAVRRRRRADAAGRGRAVVVVRRGGVGLRHGAALPEPVGGGGRHRPPATGAARPSASTASGATSATASARCCWARWRRWRAASKPPSGSPRPPCSSPVWSSCWRATKRTRASIRQ